MTERSNAVPAKERGYSGEVPLAAIAALGRELEGLIHGAASLTLHVRNGRLVRFTASRERSFLEGDHDR
jgi:hypothetical protein